MYEQVAKDVFGSEKQALLKAIEHELGEIEAGILGYSAKYGCGFGEFSSKLDSGKIPNPHSYEVELDFMEWEALEARKTELVNAFRRLH